MMSRSEKAEENIIAHQNELARVNHNCDAQMIEMSNSLRAQREQLNHVGAESARVSNELADCKFELQRHSALTMSKERELQNANRRISDLLTEGQLASDQHRASLIAADNGSKGLVSETIPSPSE